MLTRLATMTLALAAIGGAAAAQPAGVPMQAVGASSTSQGILTQQQLQELVAPIALYPDALLTDILAASTYPTQVVEAQRFLTANPNLQDAALTDAAAGHDWDPSVQALLPFPQVLQLLDGNLEWTDSLGRAFMAQQADVLNAVQTLRLQAERAGTLRNGPEESVVNDGTDITINPPSPQQVYLPTYDAACAYGPGVFAPGVFEGAGGCNAGNAGIAWDDGIFLPYGYGQWGLLDWGDRRIHFDHDGDHWRHPGWDHHHGGDGRPGSDHIWRHTASRGATPGQRLTFGGVLASGRGFGQGASRSLDAGRGAMPTHGFAATQGFAHRAPEIDHFNYAPPSGQRSAGFTPHSFAPARFGAGSSFRGTPGPSFRGPSGGGFAARASGPVGAAHAGGFAGGAGHR